MKPQALCAMRFAGGWYNPEMIGETASLRASFSCASTVSRAAKRRGATGNRRCAASSTVDELRGFRFWPPLSGGFWLVRNSWEHPRPSSKAVPEPLPPKNCLPLPLTRGDLLPSFSLEQGLKVENRVSDLRLPSCAESSGWESRNYFGQRN